MCKLSSFITANAPVLTADYLAVLTKKLVGGFDLAVLTNFILRISSTDPLWWCFAFCNIERLFILSLIRSFNVYA